MRKSYLLSLLLSLSSLAGLTYLSGCADRDVSRGGGFPEMTSTKDSLEAERQKKLKAMGKFIGIVVEKDSGVLKMPAEQLIPRFQREFKDGTVVTKVVIAKNHPNKQQKPIFYLVGYGLNNGRFRSMAFELLRSDEDGLYLSRISERHVCYSNSRCSFCAFTFTNTRITGCECTENNTTSTCEHTTAPSNTLFAD